MVPEVPWQPGDPIPEDYVESRHDGLPARDQGVWAKDKLRFLEKYLPGAVGATKKKRGHTHYIDLFAGCGRNAWIDGPRYEDFEGSPLIALKARFSFRDEPRPKGFGHLHFCNIDSFDFGLLKRRLETEAEMLDHQQDVGEIHMYLGDSNDLISKIVDDIPSWAYIAAFLDIEGPSDLAFSTVEALKSKHDSVDAYILYPTGSLPRSLPYDPEERKKFEPMLDRYYGNEGWQPIVKRRKSTAQASRMDRELRKFYMDRLREHWKHVEQIMPVKGPKGKLYHMLFAYNHEAAGSIADTASRGSQQEILFDQPKPPPTNA